MVPACPHPPTPRPPTAPPNRPASPAPTPAPQVRLPVGLTPAQAAAYRTVLTRSYELLSDPKPSRHSGYRAAQVGLRGDAMAGACLRCLSSAMRCWPATFGPLLTSVWSALCLPHRSCATCAWSCATSAATQP